MLSRLSISTLGEFSAKAASMKPILCCGGQYQLSRQLLRGYHAALPRSFSIIIDVIKHPTTRGQCHACTGPPMHCVAHIRLVVLLKRLIWANYILRWLETWSEVSFDGFVPKERLSGGAYTCLGRWNLAGIVGGGEGVITPSKGRCGFIFGGLTPP